MAKLKISNALAYSLAIISIVGFLGIVGKSFADIDWITNNTSAIILIVLGIGLTFEGKIREWMDFKNDGYNSSEIAHLITGLIGLFAIFSGFLSLIGLEGPTLLAVQGIIASIAILIIIIQTWWVK